MSPRHHPRDSLLASYAAGELPTAAGLPISAHLEVCASCRATVRAATKLAGELLSDEREEQLSPNILDAVMARLDEPEPPEPPPGQAPAGMPLPRALTAIGVRRRRWFGVGAWVAHTRLSNPQGWKSFILTLPAGGRLPAHRHHGEELIFVLQGRFTDGANEYRSGDIAMGTGQTSHQLLVADSAACTCLVAVQGAPLWRNPAMVLLRPLTGI